MWNWWCITWPVGFKSYNSILAPKQWPCFYCCANSDCVWAYWSIQECILSHFVREILTNLHGRTDVSTYFIRRSVRSHILPILPFTFFPYEAIAIIISIESNNWCFFVIDAFCLKVFHICTWNLTTNSRIGNGIHMKTLVLVLFVHQLMHQWVVLKNNIKIYIKTAPTCFGVTVTPSSGSALICAY